MKTQLLFGAALASALFTSLSFAAVSERVSVESLTMVDEAVTRVDSLAIFTGHGRGTGRGIGTGHGRGIGTGRGGRAILGSNHLQPTTLPLPQVDLKS